MAKFQIIDLFQRDATQVATSMQITADSIDVAPDGAVVFYASGAKHAIAYLGSGFIVQKMDSTA